MSGKPLTLNGVELVHIDKKTKTFRLKVHVVSFLSGIHTPAVRSDVAKRTMIMTQYMADEGFFGLDNQSIGAWQFQNQCVLHSPKL